VAGCLGVRQGALQGQQGVLQGPARLLRRAAAAAPRAPLNPTHPTHLTPLKIPPNHPSGNLISAGVREQIRFLAQHSMVDVLVTTAGGIEEDFIKCLGHTYMGDFALKGGCALRGRDGGGGG
jgi:hypothetical protein